MEEKECCSIHFETLGCRLNQDESEGAARAFEEFGFRTDSENITARRQIDTNTILCVVNTCTVTAKAEQKARRIIRLLLQIFPNSVLIITGCYAQLDGPQIKSISPERIVILPGRKKFLLQFIARILSKLDENELKRGDCSFLTSSLDFFLGSLSLPRRYKDLDSFQFRGGKEQKAFTLYTPVFKKHSRSSLKIQDGCNNACTFCRIHLARGKSVSLNVDEIIRRVREFEKTGAEEAVLTGVNLSQYYGLKNNGSFAAFAELLQILLAETERISFRISSFYPQHITEELCSVLSSNRVQPSFHLSVQSGSDNILQLMARPYSRDSVINAVNLLRKTKKNPFIGCDIIAGFPGESERDFDLTKDLCTQLNFSWIHAFPFSPRPGTPAFAMKNQISEKVKSERVSWLTEMAIKGKLDFIASCVGEKFSAIVENSRSMRVLSSANTKIIHAVTENFLHVECNVNENIASGSRVNLKILSADESSIRSGKEIDCRGILLGKES